jgi:hypothetical protein
METKHQPQNNLQSVKVHFEDSKLDYITDLSPTATEQSAREYFVGKSFDLGIFPNEDFHKCIAITFNPSL